MLFKINQRKQKSNKKLKEYIWVQKGSCNEVQNNLRKKLRIGKSCWGSVVLRLLSPNSFSRLEVFFPKVFVKNTYLLTHPRLNPFFSKFFIRYFVFFCFIWNTEGKEKGLLLFIFKNKLFLVSHKKYWTYQIFCVN